jgi:hypothetical protein
MQHHRKQHNQQHLHVSVTGLFGTSTELRLNNNEGLGANRIQPFFFCGVSRQKFRVELSGCSSHSKLKLEL